MRLRRGGQRLPTVVLALAASAAVLALASAAVEPYLAAAGNAATAAEVERTGPRRAGLAVTVSGAITPQAAAEAQRRIDEDLSGGVGTTALTVQVDPTSLGHGDEQQRVRLVAGSGAADRLELLEGQGAGGLLVPDVLADETGLSPGDAVTVARGDALVDATIAGVYRQLDTLTAPDDLSDLAELAEPSPGRDQRPLDLVFGDPLDVLAVADGVGANREVTWHHPAPTGLASLEEARATRNAMLRVARDVEEPATAIGAAFDEVSRRVPDTTIGLGAIVRDADRAVAALAGPARAVGVAGQAVALAVVGAAALFAARHRTIELRLATVRGQGPVRQGGRAALRALPAMVAGAALGWGAALLLVRIAGPPGRLPTGTATTALRDVALALAPALLVVAGVTAGVVATAVRVGRRRRLTRLARAPWELLALGLAAVALVQVRTGGGLALEAGSPQLSPLVLAFPVLVLLGAVGLGVRAARRGLPALRRIGGASGHAGYLAVRRLAAASGQGLVLAAACALALGLVVYTAALSGSLAVAVEEKSVLQLGAHATATGGDVDPDAVDGAQVLRARGRLAPGDELVDVLLVDADRFVEVAYWDPGLADGRDLATLLAPLRTADERLPVVAAGLDGTAAVVDVPGFRVPVEITADLEAFPGQSVQRPLLVASREAARALAPAADGDPALPAGRWSAEVWAAGGDAAQRLEQAGAVGIRSGAQAAEQPRLVAVTWALGALQALAVLATVLALVGVLLFVAGRQRETQVSYALARRMGLRPGTHRVALSTEVLVLLAIALIAATLLGVVAAAVVAGGLDPLPDLRPAPRTAWPLRTLAALTATLVVAGVGGAALLQRGADRANVAEVLRRG